MSASYHADLGRGLRSAVRYRLGEGVNVWGLRVTDCANRLDALGDEITPAVAAVLRDLFEEIGQQTTDAFAAIESMRR